MLFSKRSKLYENNRFHKLLKKITQSSFGKLSKSALFLLSSSIDRGFVKPSCTIILAYYAKQYKFTINSLILSSLKICFYCCKRSLTKVKNVLKKTRGIVINYTKYSETSIIVKIFTEELGMKTYIVNGVRSNKNGSKIALYQPLTLLDLVVYFKQNHTGVQRISEAKCHAPFHNIPFNFQKSTMALFLAEVLGKALREEGQNHLLFDFLLQTLLWFDDEQEAYKGFHLQFLTKIPCFLGFDPQSADVLLAQINEHKPLRFPPSKTSEIKAGLNQLIHSQFNEVIWVPSSIRKYIIDLLLDYFRVHTAGFGEIKSLTVLREMMD